MSSSLQLDRINIPQLSHATDSGRVVHCCTPSAPPSTAAVPPPRPPPPSWRQPRARTEDIDNANHIGRRRADNKTWTCSHHCHHSRGGKNSNDSNRSRGTATKGTVYTPPPPLPPPSLPPPPPPSRLHSGQHTDTSVRGSGAGAFESTCEGIHRRRTNDSVQCASAAGDTHHHGGGTLTTTAVGLNFNCVSTLRSSGRVTCAVQPQPRPLECVHRRCRPTTVKRSLAAAPASSIQDPSQTETLQPTTLTGIGKHFCQALDTNTVQPITTTSATTTSWASTSTSVSSPQSVQDFAKCLTAEEKSTPPENSLAKGPLSANPCDFVLSELYFSPLGDIFCYNLCSGAAVALGVQTAANSLQGLLSDSLSHFCSLQRIFLVANQSSHSHWLGSNNQLTDSVQKFNFLILSANNLNSVLLFVNNELVCNLNENLYFPLSSLSSLSSSSSSSLSPSSPSSSALSSSSSPEGVEAGVGAGARAEAEAEAETSAAVAVNLKGTFGKSFNKPPERTTATVGGEEESKDSSQRKAISDVLRRQTSPITTTTKTTTTTTTKTNISTSPTRHHVLDIHSYTPLKASHSLLKVSDVQKNPDSNNNNTTSTTTTTTIIHNSSSSSNSNNINNHNEQQCNQQTTVKPSSLVTDKTQPTSHFVEENAFKASQRLKRLEENFKDLTIVRKVIQKRHPINGNVPENRLTHLTRSQAASNQQPLTFQSPTSETIENSKREQNEPVDKDVNNSSSSSSSSPSLPSPSLSRSVLLTLAPKEEDVKSSTTSAAITPSKDNESITKTSSKTKNSNLSDSNNNLNLPTSTTDSSCQIGNNSNNNLHKNVNDSSASFVNTSNSSSSRRKDIFYITRPPLSISEFDVRQLNDIQFDRKSNHFLTLECYDELLDDVESDNDQAETDSNDDEENSIELPPSSPPFSVNTPTPVISALGDNDCDNNEFVYVCNCQKHCCATLNQVDLSRVQIPPTNSFTSSLKQFGGARSNESPTKTKTSTNSSHSTVDFDIEMREINGQLRGLLKKPNRPPPARKNRVVFDETRNEFFEADYIILIREDCAYDEEDEEPCTCGEHELVRLCCEEGCQCNYTNEDTRTPQSPKFAPPIEFVDEAALSPPDGYKDNGLKNTLGGALSGHIFGAQHIQQLQVIQRLQQQRAAMLAARNSNQGTQPPLPPATAALAPAATAVTGQQPPAGPAAPASGQATQLQPPPSQSQSQLQPHSPDDDSQPVCTECAECVECAAKQLQESECTSPQCQEEVAQLSVPTVALVPLHSSSPERRITQKEIIAGEERPKYILQAQYKPASDEKDKKLISVHKNQRFVVETITMTTVTERRIVREASEDITTTSTTTTPQVILQTAAAAMAAGTTAISQPASSITAVTAAAPTATLVAGIGVGPGIAAAAGPPASVSEPAVLIPEPKPPIPPKESSPTQISGILKGGKLWKQESISQSDDMNTSSEDDTNAKRSVRFVTEDTLATSRDGDGQAAPDSPEHDSQINELIPIKKHSTLFTNALRPNSAVRQLFPSAVHQTSSMLTHEALRAFDESKRAGNLLPNLVGGNPGDSDTVRRSIERNILRRSLIKKKAVKSDISLEERIKQLTCDIDESNEDPGQDSNDENGGKTNSLNGEPVAHRDSPTGEENPQQKYSNDKSFSPSSSVSSSSSGSSSAYKKISDIFNRDKKQEKIMEMEENPIVIIPQECRCPAAPDLGMGIQVPVVHTQIHRTPPRQTEPKRQFLSTLAPLTACVAGQKDDLSYYTLAAAEGNSPANTHFAQYNMGDIEPVLCNDEMRKVAPDVIAGTPGQEQDELAAFAQQEANRTEKIKKRYTNETSNASSDDDEQNDYGFNKRPSVRGIKPKFSSTNEILQQMQDQLNKSMPSIQNNAPIKSYTLPKQASSSSINSQIQNVQPQNPQIPAATAISQQQTERTWSFYGDPEQQRIPMDGNMHPGYYHTMPTVFQQTFQGQEETLMYQNCVTMEQHYGRYARSPTRRPESPPPLRNYHQTMVLIPYNAETYSQFAATSVDPKVAQIQRQNILEYQQVTQQTIRVPISYALPAMQLHVVAGRGHATQQYVQHQQQHIPPQQQTQRILAPRYSMPQDGTMGFSERGVPEGAAAVSHTDCKGIVSPTSQTSQPPMQQQQQQQQMQSNCNQSTVTSTGPPGSVFYAMNV